MSKNTKIDCLEFKELVLADPECSQQNFVEHAQTCPDCLRYAGEVRAMDQQLQQSLNVDVPNELLAKIKLGSELSSSTESVRYDSWYGSSLAKVASLAVVAILSVWLISSQIVGVNTPQQQDYVELMNAVLEHVDEVPTTPVWGHAQANLSVNASLASYGGGKLNYLDNLQFGRICPMGRYRGLHATLDTSDGQVTFAYIKGDSLAELRDLSANGYVSRIRPVKDGNIVIVSRSNRGLNIADEQLSQAMYWDI